MTQVKFYFGPHASNLANTFYMQWFTVVCEFQSCRVIGGFGFFMSGVFGHRHVFAVSPKREGRMPIPWRTAKEMVRMALVLLHEQDFFERD
jgi:hypothetical protein